MAQLAWSGGYLSARGSLGFNQGSIQLTLQGRGEDMHSDLLRLALPLEGRVHYTLRPANDKGHAGWNFALRSRQLHLAMVMLEPYLSPLRKAQYNDLAIRYKAKRNPITVWAETAAES